MNLQTKQKVEKKLQDSLRFLREALGHDNEALEALEVIEVKLSEGSFEEKRSKRQKTATKDEFYLPDDMIKRPLCYALFSDGACRGNPGPGAWGAIGQDFKGNLLFEASGVEFKTTNNRMELEGAIQALVALQKECEENKESSEEIQAYLYSDSKYVVDGMNQWVVNWKKRGWKKADKKEPENVDRWKRLDELASEFYKVHFKWVKGHDGHPQNERCDELANVALDEAGL